MLNNVNGTQWGYNLINFDSSRLYALPSYYMQQMFRDAAGQFLLDSKLGGTAITMATAGMQRSDVVVKLVSYSGNATTVTVSLTGFSVAAGDSATLQVLSSSSGPDAANTLLAPEFVTPVTSQSALSNNEVTVNVPAWSIIVLRIPTTN